MSNFDKALLIGWNGKLNAGDDLMTWSILKQLQLSCNLKEALIWADESQLPRFDFLGNCEVSGIKNFKPTQKIKGVRSLVNQFYLAPKYIKDVDVLIVGGGSIFHSTNGMRNMFKLIEHAKSKNPGIKVFACSVSIGPFKDAGAEAMVVKLLSEFDRISVRDERSFAVCNGLGLATMVKCFPDIALSYPKLSNVIHEDVQNNVPQVGISLRHGHVDDETISVFTRVLSFLEELMPNFRLVILELCDFHRSRDRNERDKLLSMLSLEKRNNVRVVTYANDFHSFYKEMNSLDFVICMRLHAAIISYATKTKFCMLPYHTKCIDFGKSIMDEWSDLLVNADDDDFNLKRKLQTILNSSSDKFFYKHRSVVEHAEEQVAWLVDRN